MLAFRTIGVGDMPTDVEIREIAMSDAVHSRRPPVEITDASSGLSLHAPRPQDAPALVDAITESLPELKRFMPWAHFENTVDSQYTRLAGLAAAYWRGDEYVLNVFEDHRILGCIGLHRRAMNDRAVELGYWVRTSAAGRGVATLAGQMAVLMAFDLFDCRRVQCGYDTANVASARVAAKIGFRVEGDLVGYGPMGNDAMRADGWATDEVIRMTALMSDARSSLDWYPAVRERVRVRNWLGRLV